jgi:hypothetical protein
MPMGTSGDGYIASPDHLCGPQIARSLLGKVNAIDDLGEKKAHAKAQSRQEPGDEMVFFAFLAALRMFL